MMLEKAIKLLKQYQGYEPMFPDGETLKHAFDLTDETVDTLLSALTPPNEPLTLDELREMNGEPVWVKRLKGLSVCDTDWAVVEFRLAPDVKHDKIRVWWPGSEDEDTPSEDDYGKTWIAYRRPPEGEANA